MRAGTSTGGPQDYIWFAAETVAECAELIRIARSEFLPDRATELVTPHDGVELRILIGGKRPNVLDADTRSAIDQTP